MSAFPHDLERLIRALARLPGIGPKTATRLALFLLRGRGSLASELADSLVRARKLIHPCPECYNLTDRELCPLCDDDTRDKGLVCVVEGPAEVAALERAGVFNGRYHVLGGLLAPLDKVGPSALRIRELKQRLRRGEIREVVIGLSSTAQGRATGQWLVEELRDSPVRVSRLALGLPMGADIEYADPETLKASLEGRN